MNKVLVAVAVSVVGLQACVVAPPQPVMVQQQPGMMVGPPSGVVPPGVVYVAPTYPAPAVDFIWDFHPRYGWGWRHPQRGWHRGWR